MIDARVAGVMELAGKTRPRCGRCGFGEGEIDARRGGRCGFGEGLGMDGAGRWTGNVDEREDTIG